MHANTSTGSGGDSCHLCQDMPDPTSPLVVLDTSDWSVFVREDSRLGCVWLQAKEHVEGLWAMTEQQVATLGSVMRATSAAMCAALNAEKIYLISLGERHAHFHALLIARTGTDEEKAIPLVALHLAPNPPLYAGLASVNAAEIRKHLRPEIVNAARTRDSAPDS
jgi:diadenosine tetraphosphate (Ap4A) HIT family hydrolase